MSEGHDSSTLDGYIIGEKFAQYKYDTVDWSQSGNSLRLVPTKACCPEYGGIIIIIIIIFIYLLQLCCYPVAVVILHVKKHEIGSWGKKTNKMRQYRWFIVNSGCWLLTLSQHVSGIFMPIFRRKTTCYCMWSVFAGSVGCGTLWYCGATLRVWSLWRLLFDSNSNLHSAHTLQQPSQCSHPTATFTVLTPST